MNTCQRALGKTNSKNVLLDSKAALGIAKMGHQVANRAQIVSDHQKASCLTGRADTPPSTQEAHSDGQERRIRRIDHVPRGGRLLAFVRDSPPPSRSGPKGGGGGARGGGGGGGGIGGGGSGRGEGGGGSGRGDGGGVGRGGWGGGPRWGNLG